MSDNGAVLNPQLDGLNLKAQGKVRDIYEGDDA